MHRLKSLHTYICFLFPLVHLLWSVTPAEHNETQTRVFCCNSEPQFKLQCLALISQKLTDAGSTQRAENCVSCSAVFVMLIILYQRGGQQTNSVAHLLVTLYATLPATREIYETHMGKGRRNVSWLIYITDIAKFQCCTICFKQKQIEKHSLMKLSFFSAKLCPY